MWPTGVKQTGGGSQSQARLVVKGDAIAKTSRSGEAAEGALGTPDTATMERVPLQGRSASDRCTRSALVTLSPTSSSMRRAGYSDANGSDKDAVPGRDLIVIRKA